MGGIGRQFQNEAGQALNKQGLETGLFGLRRDNTEIDASLAKQMRELTAGMPELEQSYRSQFAKSQADQQDYMLKQQDYLLKQQAAKAKLTYQSIQLDQAQQKIDLEYKKLRATTTNKNQKLELDQWYKEQSLVISARRAAIAQQQADISQGRLDNTVAQQDKPGGGKPPSASSVSTTVQRATKAGNDIRNSLLLEYIKKQPGIAVPKDWDKEKNGEYKLSPKYQAAMARARQVASMNFNQFMHRVTAEITPHLRNLGWTREQIARRAYAIVREKVTPGPGYKPPKGV
jgi:hypothetical protein